MYKIKDRKSTKCMYCGRVLKSRSGRTNHEKTCKKRKIKKKEKVNNIEE